MDSTNTKKIPAIGSIVRPATSDIKYRVISAHEHGCSVEAIDTHVETSPGRKPRPLHYSEKRASLAVCRTTGTLFDARWNAWVVV